MICQLTRQQKLILCALILIGLTITGIASGLYVHRRDYTDSDSSSSSNSRSDDISFEALRGGGAVTNGHECADIGRDTIYKGGSVVDAGIAMAICEGVAMAQSMGLGGGFFATIYIRETGEVFTLNARETAPAAATQDMYINNTEGSTTGGLAAAIPGEVRGYQQLHQRFGKLPWHELFQPTIKLCRSGLLVNEYLDKLYKQEREMLLATEGFSDFINPATNEPYQLGDRVKRMKLAETLEIIASEPDALHQGSLTEGFVKDIQDLGGIITVEDMNNYQPVWAEPIRMPLRNNQTLYTFPPPGSGPVLAHIMALLNDHLDLGNINNVINWQRIIESFKFAYGMRTNLGDPLKNPEVNDVTAKLVSKQFISEIRAKMHDDSTSQDPEYYGANTTSPEDHGTAHVNILAPNGDAFTFTGTINLIFGAKVVSKTTGIILNDEMDDFSTQKTNAFGLPSSPANFIAPGKRPFSSMCPSIILDAQGNVRMLVGAAGGSKITTSSALVALRHLWYNETVKDAVKHPRMHHQLFPMSASYDPEFQEDLVEQLHQIGHVMVVSAPDGFGAVTALTNSSGVIEMSSDPRRCGSNAHI